MVPTESSIKEAADKLIRQVNSGFGRAFSRPSSGFAGDVAKGGFAPGQTGTLTPEKMFGKGFAKTMESMGTMFKRIPGVEAVGAGLGAAKESGAGAGGKLAAIAGSLSALLESVALLSVSLLIISAFFEAVGPFLRMIIKVIGAFFMILLAPIFRALAPYLPGIIKALMDLGRWLAGGLAWLIQGVMDFLKDPWGKLQELGSWLLDLVGKGVKWALGFFFDTIKKAPAAVAGFTWDTLFPFLKIFKEGKATFPEVVKKPATYLNPAGTMGTAMGFDAGLWFKTQVLGLDKNWSIFDLLKGGEKMKTGFDDFIARPGMAPTPFNANDTIIGVKGTKGLGGRTEINITNNLRVDAGVDEAKFSRLLDKFARAQGKELRYKNNYPGGFFA